MTSTHLGTIDLVCYSSMGRRCGYLAHAGVKHASSAPEQIRNMSRGSSVHGLSHLDRTINCGVIYVATGQNYVDAAIRSAESVKAVCGDDIPIHLFSDREPQDGIFSGWDIIENPKARSKVEYLHKSPFEYTLYLDCDTRAVQCFMELFDLLDRYDIGLCHAQRRLKTHNMVWREAVPYSFPQLNSGVFLYHRSEAVIELLKSWADAFHESGFKKDQITLRELLWKSDLRLAILPPEYNIRYPRNLKHFARDVSPKIIHDPRFVEGKTSLAKRAGRKLKSFYQHNASD